MGLTLDPSQGVSLSRIRQAARHTKKLSGFAPLLIAIVKTTHQYDTGVG
jgi:hypothetical protein